MGIIWLVKRREVDENDQQSSIWLAKFVLSLQISINPRIGDPAIGVREERKQNFGSGDGRSIADSSSKASNENLGHRRVREKRERKGLGFSYEEKT